MTASCPPADCKVCGKACRAIIYSTFAYWYCDKCRDEVEVYIHTTKYSKAEKPSYAASDPTDINIGLPGIYKIEYNNGDIEWYEHTDRTNGSGVAVLDGSRIRHSTRINASDMPSRKQVLLSISSGALSEERGHGSGSIPNARYRTIRTKTPEVNLPGDIIAYAKSSNTYGQLQIDGTVVHRTENDVWADIRSGVIGAQQWKVPPEDYL